MKKIFIVDGNSILNRAFYGVKGMTRSDGFPTNALFGMLHMLIPELEGIAPDLCVMAFDRHEPTFRHKMYAEYKAGRHATPEEFLKQFAPAKEIAAAWGFEVVEQSGYEADDILGTLSAEAEAEGWETVLMTGDRDSFQLISDHITVHYPGQKGTVVYTPAVFEAEYGITPAQFVDMKALMGDNSDNIPGVSSIGPTTAGKLIAQFGSLDGVYANLDDPSIKKSARAHLEADRDSAYFSQTLARIVRDAPLDKSFHTLRSHEKLFDRETMLSLLMEYDLNSAINRLGLKGQTVTSQSFRSPDPLPVTADELAGKLSPAVLTALQCDTAGGVMYFCADGALYSVPLTDPALPVILSDGARSFSAYDCKTLYHTLDTLSLPLPNTDFDPMLAAYVVSATEGSYAPATLCMQYLNQLLPEEEQAEEEQKSRKKKEAVYSPAVLCALTSALTAPLKEKLTAIGADSLFYEIELPLARVLYRMEERGFRVDTAGIAAYGEQLAKLCSAYEEQIYTLAGKEFNINSPQQLGKVLFTDLNLGWYLETAKEREKRAKRNAELIAEGKEPEEKKFSTNADVLEKLVPHHPIVADVLEYRQVSKLKSTYADGLQKVADADGRIHSSFNQTVTATGRLSSTEPNLQNIPVRTELGREFRRYFIPCDSDHLLVDADYSQIELRILAALSGDKNMIDAFLSGTDIHAVTASQVFRVPLESVTPELRKRAKAVNFGIVYGIGAYSLSQDIGVTTKQASAYIDSYFATYPGVSAFLKNSVKDARERGYAETYFGRRRYIPELAATNHMTAAFGERVAMNSPIQGTAADIIKRAMVMLDKRLTESGLDARLILQVHDELIVDCQKDCADEVKEILRDVMEHAVSFAVPMSVDVQAGATWYDGH